MRITIGADHAGFVLKDRIGDYLKAAGHAVTDVGTHDANPVDYPDYAVAVGEKITRGQADLGILCCGSGVGAAIAANKIPGIRAALCHDTFSAHQSREDDDANMLCLGPRVIGPELALEIVRVWLSAQFSQAERHRRRVQKVIALEIRYRER